MQKGRAGIIRALGALTGLMEPARPPMGHPPALPCAQQPWLSAAGALVPAVAMLSVHRIPAKRWMGLPRWVSDPCHR